MPNSVNKRLSHVEEIVNASPAVSLLPAASGSSNWAVSLLHITNDYTILTAVSLLHVTTNQIDTRLILGMLHLGDLHLEFEEWLLCLPD